MSNSLTISFEVRATMNQEVVILDKNVGADDLIAKPFNPIELVLRVKRFFLNSK